MSNMPGMPLIPPNDENREAVDADLEFAEGTDGSLDPDVDADQVDSAEADRRAVTEGVRDSVQPD